MRNAEKGGQADDKEMQKRCRMAGDEVKKLINQKYIKSIDDILKINRYAE